MRSLTFISVVILFLGLVVVVCIAYFGFNFSADIYRHSESYIVEYSEEQLISRVNQFKDVNKEFRLITTNEKGETIYYKDSHSSKYYHVFFYFSDIDLVMQCLLSPIDDKKSSCKLYAVSKGVNFSSWKTINTNELKKKENNEIKKKFETEILSKLGNWKFKRWYN